MNPYYLNDSLAYPFGNGYSSGSATSSPAGGLPLGSGGAQAGAGLPTSLHGHGHSAHAHGHAPQGGSTAAASSSSAAAPQPAAALPPPTSGPFVQPHQDLNEFLESFWTRQMDGVERETPDFKTYNLPLARIKKVMKSDEEVKMISAEAPIMFSKACEIFISELTCRAWLVAEGHKRRTLQKSDVAAAIAFSDVFDFLIDIVPREGDEPPAAASTGAPQQQQTAGGSTATSAAGSTGPPSQAQMSHAQQSQQQQVHHSAQAQHHPQQHHAAAAHAHVQPQQHYGANHGGFNEDGQWQPADGEYGGEPKGVYEGYDEGRDSEALYSEYVQGEGEGFG